MATSEKTLQSPAGARFYRCALQVNPWDYLQRHSKTTSFANEAAYNEAMVAACKGQGIEVVGITDHYRVKTGTKLAAALRAADIAVLPGFEAVTKEGVHFLCLFGPDTAEEEVDRRIGECGVVGGDDPSPLGHFDAIEFLQKCSKWRAVCIAAHVGSNGGLLTTLRGQSAVNCWRSEHLMACSLPGPVSGAPQKIRAILENSDPQYKRKRPIAVLNAQDVDDPSALSNGSAVTLIKMSAVGLDGLSQAFLDPESRIRLTSDPAPVERTEFVAIEWTGGFLDGVGIRLNENLNTLIGGPGSGKSTIIESIRYVLDLSPVGSEARKAHEGVVKQVLRPGTQISLLLRSPFPSQRDYLIERTVPNPPAVYSAEGDLLDVSPNDVAPRVEVYGQHEISEIARSPQERTRLLARFLEGGEADEGLESISRRLPDARTRVVNARQRETQIDEELAALPGLSETLKRYEEAGLEDRLRQKSLLVRENAPLQTARKRVASLESALEGVAALLPIEHAFLSDNVLKELPNREALKAIGPTLDVLSEALGRSAAAIGDALADARAKLDTIEQNCQANASAIENAYQKALRDLQKTNVDGTEFIRLRERIEQLRPLTEQREKNREEITKAEKSRESLILALENARARQFRALESAAKRVSRQLSGRVRVTVKFEGDREPLVSLLRANVSGRLSETFDLLRKRDDFSTRAFAQACREGADKLSETYRVPRAQAARLVEAGEPLFMQLEEIELPSTTELELNVAGSDAAREDWRRLDDLSAGQKATAVLLLLLLESDAPLVIDQPEDDLGSRFITDGVVPKMREEKRRRQFVFSTHNANIPVLGDSELIVGLSAFGEAPHGQASITEGHAGSIDVESVRHLVEELLEGGEDAFELRRLKYGIA